MKPTRAQKQLALEIMREADAYATRTTAAALMHNDEKLQRAREQREKLRKLVDSLVMRIK